LRGSVQETWVCTWGWVVEGAIEKPSELSSWDSELVAVAEEPAARLVRKVWPECVTRASAPATTRPAAARTATARFATPARGRADSIRDTAT
jgi:hypothetical protein